MYYLSPAYYNAGSAALVLMLTAVLVGGFLCWRSRRSRSRGLSLSTREEHIPLNSSMADVDEPKDHGFRSRKGKERARSPEEDDAIFDVGDDDDEDERSPRPRG